MSRPPTFWSTSCCVPDVRQGGDVDLTSLRNSIPKVKLTTKPILHHQTSNPKSQTSNLKLQTSNPSFRLKFTHSLHFRFLFFNLKSG